jgi:hypothetical protein
MGDWMYADDDNNGPLSQTLVEAAMNNKGLSEKLMNEIRQGLRHGASDALYSLLLLLCTNLRVWMTVFEREMGEYIVSRTIEEVVHSGSALQQVQGVSLIFPVEDLTASLWELRPVLDLPRLREIRASRVDVYGYVNFASSSHPNIRQIFLERANTDAGGVDLLFRACECLETLSIEFGGPNEWMDPVEVEDYPGIGHVLRHHGANLLQLTILRSEPDDDDEEEDQQIRYRTPLGSLAELSSLRELTISFEALYGVDESQLNL